jgi:hypothetical protein
LRRAGILHPNVLTEKGIHPYFLFIVADDYRKFRSFLAEQQPEGSWFSLYGHDDYLCKICCSDKFFREKMLIEMEKYGAISYFQGDNIYIESGFTVPKNFTAPDTKDEEDIDRLQSDCSSASVPLETKTRLLEQSTFIGYGILEDYMRSDMIKAVVGVTFKRGMSLKNLRNLIDKILNGKFREYITGLYEGKGKIIDYDLIIEFLLDRYYDLNRLTDELYPLGDIETHTHLVAEPIEQEITRRDKLYLFEEIPEDISIWANKTLKEIYDSLPPESHSMLRKLSEKEKTMLIARYRLLSSLYEGRVSKARNLEQCQTATKQFLNGMVTKKESYIAFSITTLTKAFETELYDLVKTNGEIAIGPEWELELKKGLHKDLERPFSLGTYLEVIEYWKGNYGFCPLGISASDQEQLKLVNKYRKPSVHGGRESLVEEEIISEDKMDELFFLICDAIKSLISIENLNIEQSQPDYKLQRCSAVLTFTARRMEISQEADREKIVRMLKEIEEEKLTRKELIEKLDKIETLVSEKNRPFIKTLGRFVATATSEGVIQEIVGMAIRGLTKI